MTMPFIDADGEAIHTEFGSRADMKAGMSEQNHRDSDNSIYANLAGGLKARPFLAACQSNEGIGQGTSRNTGMLQMHRDAGWQIGTSYETAHEDASSALTIGTTA